MDWLASSSVGRALPTAFALHSLTSTGEKHVKLGAAQPVLPASFISPNILDLVVTDWSVGPVSYQQLNLSATGSTNWISRDPFDYILSQTFSKSTGLWTGELEGRPPATPRPRSKFKGVILPVSGKVQGFFLKPVPAPGQSASTAPLESMRIKLLDQ